MCQGGTISASPSICNIDAATGVCASTIAWSTTGASLVRVKVFFYESGATQVFSTAKSGSSVAPWINAAGMRFDLQADGEVVAAVDVVGNPPPSVSLTAPSAGAVLLSGQAITLSANASDADGVSKVEFFDGATLIATDTSAPYSVNWSSTTLGSHSLSARATDSRSAVRTAAAVAVTVAQVTLSASNKTVNSSVASGGTASAAFRLASAGKLRFQTSVGGLWVEQSPFAEWLEPESGITATQFEVLATSAGGVLPSSGTMNLWLNLGSAAPRDWVLTRSTAGTSQSVVTIAIRKVGTTTAIASTNVTLNAVVTAPPNQLPSVALTGPANNQRFDVAAGGTATIALAATASDSDGTISKVEFFRSGSATPVLTDTIAPYAGDWNNVAIGTYSLTAKATDNGGASASSTAVGITVNALPTASMPTPPAQTAPAGGTCTFSLSATANDSDGSIAQVEFLNNGVPLTGTTGNPNPDTAAPYAFTWSNVAPGSYSLSARATDNRGAATTSSVVTASCTAANIPPSVSLTDPTNNQRFDVPAGGTATIPLAATASDSDGTISKVEFFQSGSATPVLTDTITPYGGNWNNVAIGTYSLTAKATDNDGASTVSSPPVTVIVNALPTTALSPLTNQTEACSWTLSATANDSDGTISQVAFFNGGVAIGSPDTSAPYNASVSGLPAGSYTFTAKATDNRGAVGPESQTSAVCESQVNSAPTVTWYGPANGGVFTAPASIVLSATATDSDGTVSAVEFFKDNGTTLLGVGIKNGDTYTFDWNNVAAGSYTLTAVATDNLNATATTPEITISVAVPAMCFILPQRPGSTP